MRSSLTVLAPVLVAAAGAACSAILDLQAPPAPDAGKLLDATTEDVASDAPPNTGSDATADGAIPPPVCAALDAAILDEDAGAAVIYSPLGAAPGGASAWEFFNTSLVDRRAGPFAGGTFDGRYVYMAPATSGLVTRLDTAATGGFKRAASWSTFDVATIGGAMAGAFSGALFDGRYVYFVPHGTGGVYDGVVRYDTSGDFGSPASWATFDASSLDVDGGRAKGFAGAGTDGRYVYFVPSNDGVAPDGRVVRYDTSRAAGALSLDAGHPDAGDAGAGDAGDVGTFGDPSSWAMFDVSAALAGAAGFAGAAFDGRALYLVPMNNGGLGNAGFSGIAARFKTDAGFTSPTSWTAIDLTTINGEAVGFSGAAFDGRYVYFVPHQRGVVLRLDTTSSQPGAPAAWSAFDVSSQVPGDGGGSPAFGGAAFDGRFVYLVPSSASFGGVVRYDTLSTFTSACAWSTLDLTTLNPAASFYFGAVFDGEYLYLIPRGNGPVARFDARTPPSMPNLPAFHGSFY